MRFSTIAFFFLLLTPFAFSQGSGLSKQEVQRMLKEGDFPQKVRGEIYFKVSPSASVDMPEFERGEDSKELFDELPDIQSTLDAYGVERIHCPFRVDDKGMRHTYKLEFERNSDARTKELLSHLNDLEYVNYAEPVQRYRSFYSPDDVHPKQKWYLDSIKASLAYDSTMGDSNTTIAVVDDAVHIDHPDLMGNVKTNVDEVPGDGVDNDGNGYTDDVHGWDAADDNGDPRPPENHSLYGFGLPVFTHGTHTSGIASAATDNGTGITGTGFNSSIIPVKVNADGSNFPLGIEAPAEGIDYAIQADADIISMSFGSENQDCTVINILQTAHNDSIFLVAAAGNDPSWDTAWPAAMEEVFAVGATTYGDSVWSNSTYGTWIDIMAPGTEIFSTLWVGDSKELTYDTLSGTSMACPMVAGVAGLMISHFDQDNPSRIESCLKKGAKNIDSIDPYYIDSAGAGRLNAYASLRCASPDTLDMSSNGLDAYDTTTSVLTRRSEREDNWSVHPNPSQGRVRWVAPKGFHPFTVDVLSLRGRQIQSIDLARERKGVIELRMLPDGLYLLRFKGADGKQSVKKLSIER